MKISAKGRYGLHILIDPAMHDPEKPRMLKDIAQSRQISAVLLGKSQSDGLRYRSGYKRQPAKKQRMIRIAKSIRHTP